MFDMPQGTQEMGGMTQVMPLIPQGSHMYNSQTGEIILVVPQGNSIYQFIPITPPDYRHEGSRGYERYSDTPPVEGGYSHEGKSDDSHVDPLFEPEVPR
jgi:hypothetical protein